MKKPVKNLPDSVKARLTKIAGSTGRPFNEVLQYYTIERFLFRLSCSAHARHFVLKGALIFYAQQIHLRRPTRDIDLQTDTSNAIDDVVQTVREALVFLGRINDRLKDFYDLWLLSQQVAFNGPTLTAAILATFNHRGTPLPAGAPVALTGDFAETKLKQWAAFLDRFTLRDEAIADFARVIMQLRAFLLPPMAAAANNMPFTATWTAAGPWQP